MTDIIEISQGDLLALQIAISKHNFNYVPACVRANAHVSMALHTPICTPFYPPCNTWFVAISLLFAYIAIFRFLFSQHSCLVAAAAASSLAIPSHYFTPFVN